MAVPGEGSGAWHLCVCIRWATTSTLELAEPKGWDLELGSHPGLSTTPRPCPDLARWAVIPEGHRAQAGTWDRDESQAWVWPVFAAHSPPLPLVSPVHLPVYLPTHCHAPGQGGWAWDCSGGPCGAPAGD